MKKRSESYLVSNWVKFLSLFLFVLLLGAYANIFAVFSPGETLDPNCGPTDTGCHISGGSSPWITSSGGIYYDQGNVNVGNSSNSLNTGIDARSYLDSIDLTLDVDAQIFAPGLVVTDDGNPVLAYYDQTEQLIIIICTDEYCNNYNTQTIAGTSLYSQPSLKIGVDGLIHVSYIDNRDIKYLTCSDEECSSPLVEVVVDGDDSWGDWEYSLTLDSDDNPYIIYEDWSDTYSNYYIKLARYTGTGIEDTCLSYSGIININWKCSTALSSTGDIDYFFGYGSKGDYLYIDEGDNLPRFVAERFVGPGDDWKLVYNVCNNTDCSDITSTIITDMTSADTPLDMDVSNNGIPYIAYVSSTLSYDEESIDLVYYVGGGNGTGCTISSDWTCQTISTLELNNEYWHLDLEMDNDNIPNIVVSEWNNNDSAEKISHIECSNSICTSTVSSYLYDGSINESWWPHASLYFDNDNKPHFSYIDPSNYSVLLLKEKNNPSISFTSGGKDLYIDGDAGINGNLFVDGNIISGQNLYIDDFIPDNTINALYNNSGNLYWNGEIINTGVSSTIVSTSVLDTETWLGTDSDDMDGASTRYTVFIGIDAGMSASGAPYSSFIGYKSGQVATGAYHSNFLGYSSGYNASGSYQSNFIGSYAGSGAGGNGSAGSNFIGYYSGSSTHSADYSNFIGHYAGYTASSASNSNFIGQRAGYQSTSASYSNFIGDNSGYSAPSASYSNFLGYRAGYNANNARNSIFIGQNAGYNDTVSTTSATDDFAILIGKSTSTGGFKNSIAIGGSATNTASNQFMIGSTTRPITTTRFQGATTQCTITTGTGIACTSDERLKTITSELNIDPITNEEISILDKLTKVRTVNFKWNDNIDGPNNIGFLAQDLLQFFPELVSVSENEDEFMSIYYSNMTPIIVEAIREMNLKVKSFEDFETEENTLRDSLSIWLANATNKITRIFTGEICLTDGSEEEAVCLNASELREIKKNLITDYTNEDESSLGDEEEVLDICPNIDGVQVDIPEGDELNEEGDCVLIVDDESVDSGIPNEADVESGAAGADEADANTSTGSDNVENSESESDDQAGVDGSDSADDEEVVVDNIENTDNDDQTNGGVNGDSQTDEGDDNDLVVSDEVAI